MTEERWISKSKHIRKLLKKQAIKLPQQFPESLPCLSGGNEKAEPDKDLGKGEHAK